MLFGLERGRGRASVNDTFSIYEPWENPNYYSGTLRFESGGKNFLLERNFDKYSKSARLICEDDGEEFSLEHGDLEMILNGLDGSNYEKYSSDWSDEGGAESKPCSGNSKTMRQIIIRLGTAILIWMGH